ncbi:CopG family transcriptional regulator [Chitinibacter fontanus]|uniref:CopG family transcriptional regulator n=1 Tax=Chitinibacter fontanus TaxID=1737446 RepID=A0A7D5VAL8_9NEIS|nr:DUF411 domain-containing protein [Chitinibacter fontanus]QLI82279.1 CopG family transcriptional regulator [Chitinibacter fontanus]
MKKISFALLLAVLSQSGWAALAATVYKDPNCGCCEAYAKYLGQNGFAVKTINSNDMSAVKQRYGADKLASCHTMRVTAANGRQYTVEGHVPVAAIHKLLKQQPDIVGIALPGMPANSPGMGPEKPGSLTIYALQNQQTTKVFSVE